MKINLFLIGLIMSLCSFTARAHDPAVCTNIIYQKGEEWRLKVSYATEGMIQAMRTYFEDESIQLEDHPTFKKQVNEYLKAHVHIQINKHFEVTLNDFEIILNHHACEIDFSLVGVPARPDYWSIQMDMGKEREKQSNLLKIHTIKQTRFFKLEKKDGFSLILMRNPAGEMRKVE